MRAFLDGQPCLIRNPSAIRPWQFVLEPLRGYLLLAERLAAGRVQRFASGWNFGPADADAKPVSWIADELARSWGDGASWTLDRAQHPREAHLLQLDASKARAALGWHPVLPLDAGARLDRRVVSRRSQDGGDLAAAHAERRSNGTSALDVRGASIRDAQQRLHMSRTTCQRRTSSFSEPAWPDSVRRIGCTPKASRRSCTTRTAYYGGHTASFRYETGFLFDIGPHISFTKDARIQELFAESVDQQYETVQINLNNYWRGHWPQHPVQLHLHGLPEDVIVKVIADFVEERQAPERPIANYEDWLLASFGRTFAELFPMQYTRKYHLTTAEQHEHRLAGAAHLSAEPRGSAARRALAVGAERALHHALPLSEPTAGSSRT